MTVSDRYRQITREVRDFLGETRKGEPGNELKHLEKAVDKLAELEEGVGEIPRIRLESQLTPVLLKAHTQLDRARLFLDERGDEDRAAAVWDLEQMIYRLLNDL